MRNLMKFGMVLVVLAMVTSVAFANRYEGPQIDDTDPENPIIDNSWCNALNWGDEAVPGYNDGEKAEIRDGDAVVIDCSGAPSGADDLQIRNGSLQVGTVTDRVSLLVQGELEMSDDSTSDYSELNIVNGTVSVAGESKDVFEDGSGVISIAAGSSMSFGDGLRIGDSNGDGCGDSYALNIAGDFVHGGDRFQVYGGTLTINLTGSGTFYTDETTRLSRKPDAMTIVNITDYAVFAHEKDIEINDDKSGTDCDASLEINISGNGSWDGTNDSKDIEWKKEGAIANITITDNGSLAVENCGEQDDAELNLIVDGDGASFLIEADLDLGQGTIEIINGAFTVEDDFELGGEDDCSMTVEAAGVVDIRNLIMEGADLTINGASVDVKSLEMDDDSVIEINGLGALVIDDADDMEDWDDIDALIADGQITTSEEGMLVVWDHDVTNADKLTLRIAIVVEVEIKPGSCPNPLRVNLIGGGVFPVSIKGSPDFDVLDVDEDTITLGGVAALRAAVSDVSTFDGGCEVLGPDGIPDLAIKFKTTDILEALADVHGDLTLLPNRAPLVLTLFAQTLDGTLITGEDCLVVLNRGAIKRKKNPR